MTKSVWDRAGGSPRKPHVVATGPTFTKGQSPEKAPLECSCGWAGIVSEWADHAPRAAVSRAWSEESPPPFRKRNSMKAACPQGHVYDSLNTYFDPNGSYICRTCRREKARGYYHIAGTRVIAA